MPAASNLMPAACMPSIGQGCEHLLHLVYGMHTCSGSVRRNSQFFMFCPQKAHMHHACVDLGLNSQSVHATQATAHWGDQDGVHQLQGEVLQARHR